MNPNTILLITQLGQLIATLGPLTLDTALKVKSLFEISDDFKVNLKTLSDEAIVADNDTITVVNEWRQAVGLPPLQL